MPSREDGWSSSSSIELEAFLPSSRASVDSEGPEARTAKTDPEREPLIQQASSASSSGSPGYTSTPRHSRGHSSRALETASSHSTSPERPFLRPVATFFHSSDETSLFDDIMEKVKNSKVAHYANKIACETEPGLTATQLMLFNHDLKPVEPERRQWGAWNFVGFWVGMFISIVILLSYINKADALDS